mmetsp:Transcript_32177/g.73728  ORF Transcript_32177/g.73728 Transcript_32177/m.73728 type:complete len:273 (+) Transcript_32177:106-924(+)
MAAWGARGALADPRAEEHPLRPRRQPRAPAAAARDVAGTPAPARVRAVWGGVEGLGLPGGGPRDRHPRGRAARRPLHLELRHAADRRAAADAQGVGAEQPRVDEGVLLPDRGARGGDLLQAVRRARPLRRDARPHLAERAARLTRQAARLAPRQVPHARGAARRVRRPVLPAARRLPRALPSLALVVHDGAADAHRGVRLTARAGGARADARASGARILRRGAQGRSASRQERSNATRGQDARRHPVHHARVPRHGTRGGREALVFDAALSE